MSRRRNTFVTCLVALSTALAVACGVKAAKTPNDAPSSSTSVQPATTDLTLNGNQLALRNVSAYFDLHSQDQYITCTGDSMILGAWDVSKAPRAQILNDTVTFDLTDLPPTKDHRLNLVVYDPSLTKATLPQARWLNVSTTLRDNALVKDNGSDPGKKILGIHARSDQGVTILEKVASSTVSYSPDPPRSQDMYLDASGNLVIDHVSWHLAIDPTPTTNQLLLLGDFNSWDPQRGITATVQNDRCVLDLSRLTYKSHRLGVLINSPGLTSANIGTSGVWLDLGSFGQTRFTAKNGDNPELGNTLAVQVVLRAGERVVESFPGATIFYSSDPAAPGDLTFSGNSIQLANASKHIRCTSSDTLALIGDFCDWDPKQGIPSQLVSGTATFDTTNLQSQDHRVGVVVLDPAIDRSNISSAKWMDTASLGSAPAIATNGNDPLGRDVFAFTKTDTSVAAPAAPIVYFAAATGPIESVPLQKQVSAYAEGATGPPANVRAVFAAKAAQLGIDPSRSRTGVVYWGASVNGSRTNGGYIQRFSAKPGSPVPNEFALMLENFADSPGVQYLGGAIWSKFRDLHAGGFTSATYYASPLGYPVLTEQSATSNYSGHRYVFARFRRVVGSSFEYGNIIHHLDQSLGGVRTLLVTGAIFDRWADLGYDSSEIGIPIEDVHPVNRPRPWPGHEECQFEGGGVVYIPVRSLPPNPPGDFKDIVTGPRGARDFILTTRPLPTPSRIADTFVYHNSKANDPTYAAFVNRFVRGGLHFIGTPTVFLKIDDPFWNTVGVVTGTVQTGMDANGVDCSGLLQAMMSDAARMNVVLSQRFTQTPTPFSLLHDDYDAYFNIPGVKLSLGPNEFPRTSGDGLAGNFFTREDGHKPPIRRSYSFTDTVRFGESGVIFFFGQPNIHHVAVSVTGLHGEEFLLNSPGWVAFSNRRVEAIQKSYIVQLPDTEDNAGKKALLHPDVQREWSANIYNR